MRRDTATPFRQRGDNVLNWERKTAMIGICKESLGAAAAAVLCASLLASAYASEPTVAGVWQQIDPGSGFVGGLISFKEKNGLWEGYIVKMYPKPGDPVDPVCSGCTDDRKDQPVLGIRLIQNAKRDGLSYEGGSILDPRNGSQYSVELTLAPRSCLVYARSCRPKAC